jgi:hypothetical protein
MAILLLLILVILLLAPIFMSICTWLVALERDPENRQYHCYLTNKMTRIIIPDR